MVAESCFLISMLFLLSSNPWKHSAARLQRLLAYVRALQNQMVLSFEGSCQQKDSSLCGTDEDKLTEIAADRLRHGESLGPWLEQLEERLTQSFDYSSQRASFCTAYLIKAALMLSLAYGFSLLFIEGHFNSFSIVRLSATALPLLSMWLVLTYLLKIDQHRLGGWQIQEVAWLRASALFEIDAELPSELQNNLKSLRDVERLTGESQALKWQATFTNHLKVSKKLQAGSLALLSNWLPVMELFGIGLPSLVVICYALLF